MRVTMKLNAEERRRGVDLRDVLSGGICKAPKKTPEHKTSKKRGAPKTVAAVAEFRPIESVETTLHDPVRDRWEADQNEGGVRLYCTSNPLTHGKDNGRWALQVRARVKIKSGGTGKHFAIGTASMSRADLLWLRGLIDAALRRTS